MKVIIGRSGNGIYHLREYHSRCPSYPRNPREKDKAVLPHHRLCQFCERLADDRHVHELENGDTAHNRSDETSGLSVEVWLE